MKEANGTPSVLSSAPNKKRSQFDHKDVEQGVASRTALVRKKALFRLPPQSGFILVVLLCIVWQLSVILGWVRSDNWPALSAVLKQFVQGFWDGEWLEVFTPTFIRMLLGYAIGTIFGIVIGAAIAASSFMKRLLGVFLALLRPLPIPALIPPLILILGVDNSLKLTVIALGVFFPVCMSTEAGVRGTDFIHRMVGRTFRVPAWRMLLRVRLPSALPYIFSGMRTSLSLALILTVIAEMTAGSDGVGYYIMSMQYAVRAADLYAAVFLLSLIGYLLNRLFLLFESRALSWSRQVERKST